MLENNIKPKELHSILGPVLSHIPKLLMYWNILENGTRASTTFIPPGLSPKVLIYSRPESRSPMTSHMWSSGVTTSSCMHQNILHLASIDSVVLNNFNSKYSNAKKGRSNQHTTLHELLDYLLNCFDQLHACSRKFLRERGEPTFMISCSTIGTSLGDTLFECTPSS